MTAVKKRRSTSTASSQPKHIKKARKTTKFHHYQPLEHLKQQIRLIELLPGKPGSRIAIKLLTVSLNDNPEYEALSYCWGPPKPSYDIFIQFNNSNENNEDRPDESIYSFTVGRNLRKALDDLRHQDRPRLIWNDAICINQKDIVEKGYQIQLMHQIYTRASVVCAWLDHNVQPRTSVFDDLENLGKGVELDDFHDPSYWYPVADIFRNEYWRRLWIQQELILAAKVDVYCRRDVFSGEQLLEFQQKVNLVKSQRTRLGGPEFVLSRYIDGNTTADATPEIFGGGVIQARINLREGREAQEAYSLSLSSSSSSSSPSPSPSSNSQSPSNPNGFKITRALLACSLLNLFLQSCSVRMTDPRDRLYGILGLATDIAQGPDLEINYAASPVWVYAQVFRHFIHRYKSLSFLCFNKGNSRGSYTSREGFPSWMPHADVCWSYVNASRACGDKLTIPHIVSINFETLCLHVQGVKVDTIKHIDHISGDGRGWTPITEWLDQMESFCHKTWPDADSPSPLYERDDVTSLMFPWLSPKRYQNMWKLDKPDPQRRVHLIRSVLAAAQKAHQVISTGDIIRGGYTPTDIIPADVREECHPLHVEINAVLLFGTEGARVGSMARTSDVRVGDEIWILFGCRMPLVMRPKKEEGKGLRYQVIGPAIVPGIMKGEVIKDAGGSYGDNGTTIILE